MNSIVVSVSKDSEHRFSKRPTNSITLVAGIGIEGDAHAGKTVQHLSRVAVDPEKPNLRQVHLMHSELLEELNEQGFDVGPSDLGENITTKGIDLLSLPTGTHLAVGSGAVIEITGLRNPCQQIERFMPGMLKEVLRKEPGGSILKRAGVMGIVKKSGTIGVGDCIQIILPDGEPIPLQGV